jgi:hypothetical protein
VTTIKSCGFLNRLTDIFSHANNDATSAGEPG